MVTGKDAAMRRSRISRRGLLSAAGVAACAGMSAPRVPAAARIDAFPPPDLAAVTVLPGEFGYDDARHAYNTRFSRFPAAVVRCRDAADVQAAVGWARGSGMLVAARSGGHSYEARSVPDGGIVIDLAAMNPVVVSWDGEGPVASIGAGARLGDICRALATEGLALPAGSCPGVGIGGLTLGGGIGYLSRRFGLTCDSLIAAEMVTAAGESVTASETENADLLWALRGGGGGLGVVTRFEFRVQPLTEVAVFAVSWPWEHGPEVFDAWQRWAPFADDRLTAALALPAPSQGAVTVTGQFAGPEEACWTALAPLLAVGGPFDPWVWSAPFLSAAEHFAGPQSDGVPFRNASGVFSRPLDAPEIGRLFDALGDAPGPACMVGCFPFGGAVAAVAPAATAFPHRNALFDLQYQAYWSDPAEAAAHLAWIDAVRDALVPAASGAYVNYLDAGQPDAEAAWFGANAARLRDVRAAWDPDGLFSAPWDPA